MAGGTVAYAMQNERHNGRIDAALNIKETFERYSLAFDQDEIENAVAKFYPNHETILSFVQWVNRRMPASSITSLPAHLFILGRKHGGAIMAVSAFKGHYSPVNSLLDLGDAICKKAEAHRCKRAIIASDEQSFEIQIDWE